MLGRLSKTLLRALLVHLYLGPQILHSMSPYHHAGTPPIEFFPPKGEAGARARDGLKEVRGRACCKRPSVTVL